MPLGLELRQTAYGMQVGRILLGWSFERYRLWVLKNSVPEAILYGAGVVLLSFLLFF
jgi:hypothetical protein